MRRYFGPAILGLKYALAAPINMTTANTSMIILI
jgi:hypothetical protein